MIDDKNDETRDLEGKVIQGPWKPLENYQDAEELGKGKVIQGPWKPLEDIAAGGEKKKRHEIERLEKRLSASKDAYHSYRNKITVGAFLSLYGALGLTDLLTDLSPATYLIALPVGVAFTRYLTEQRRTRLQEFKAYIEAKKRPE